MKYFEPKEIEASKLYSLLSDAVTPRPIAFVSTIDDKGNKNLSPFSFFGMFSINPPILIFSIIQSKHRLKNMKQTGKQDKNKSFNQSRSNSLLVAIKIQANIR